jgi:hypothetical protein
MRVSAPSVALAFLVASGAAFAQQPDATPKRSCFLVTQFDNWKAADNKTVYVRANMTHYYRLDMAQECPALRWPDSHLIMNVRGPDTICSALDWDLKVSDGPHGIAMPCIVKTMTELAPADAQALPPKFKP